MGYYPTGKSSRSNQLRRLKAAHLAGMENTARAALCQHATPTLAQGGAAPEEEAVIGVLLHSSLAIAGHKALTAVVPARRCWWRSRSP